MSKTIKADEPQGAQAVAIEDLSEAIEESVEKAPGEEVRSVRVFDGHYRCNWWVRDDTPGPMYLNTGRIVKSKFFRAIMSGEKLVLEDLSQRPPNS